MSQGPVRVAVRFVPCDPASAPASDLLTAMRAELDTAYETAGRLDNPPLDPAELRPPGGTYLVGYLADDPVAGGGVRRLAEGLGEVKRMYVRPPARSRGVARALLAALEDVARALGYTRVRLDTGPKQAHALTSVPPRRVRRGAALQRQPVRLLLGREVARMRRGDPPMHVPEWAAQQGFDVRLSWGPAGVEALGPHVAVLVLVDVLRFTTAVDVATARGAAVRPATWPFDPARAPGSAVAPDATHVVVADGSGPGQLGLSPGGLAALGPGDDVVLPSANGSHCSALAAGSGAVVVAACLRNATAVARYAAEAGPGAVGIVPCGERWGDGRLRPAVEDLVGAGAVVGALAAPPYAPSCRARGRGRRGRSAACTDLAAMLDECESGRELHSKGLAGDLVWAAACDVSDSVPVLGADGAYRSAPFGPDRA